MANEKRTIRIDSILGGIAPTDFFSASDQYYSSTSIDPSAGIQSGVPSDYGRPSGAIVPIISDLFAVSTANAPLWMISTPKSDTVYIYDYSGSTYTLSGSTVSGLGDLNDGGTAQGNGAAYYDNYVYFSRSTTIARYGPLNGSPSFTDDFWVGTLGKTALSDTTYPGNNTTYVNVKHSNHVLHRHSDGKLYIADVLDNQGTIHFIQTSKTTVEGDTDNGSTYDKLHVGYGLWPTAIESYGTDLAIALYEGQPSTINRTTKAKIAFWDTTSAKPNSLIWVEFPDQIITAMKNVNGILYVVSGQAKGTGFRLSRFIGGYSFEEVAYFGNGYIPMAGAVYSDATRLFFGGRDDNAGACTYMYGLRSEVLGKGIFPLNASPTAANGAVTALSSQSDSNGDGLGSYPAFGFTDTSSSAYRIGTNSLGSTVTGVLASWESQTFKIGKRFKILSVRLPFGANLPSTALLSVRIYTDNAEDSYLIASDLLSHTGKKAVTLRPPSTLTITGENDFRLRLGFATSTFVVTLPITIEYEVYDD